MPEQVLVPGVIACHGAHVEHPQLVAQRILRFVALLGPQRVQASTDCGFATTAKNVSVTADIAWRKLAVLAAGAKLAAAVVINANAPVTTSLVLTPTPFRVLVLAAAAELPALTALTEELHSRGLQSVGRLHKPTAAFSV